MIDDHRWTRSFFATLLFRCDPRRTIIVRQKQKSRRQWADVNMWLWVTSGQVWVWFVSEQMWICDCGLGVGRCEGDVWKAKKLFGQVWVWVTNNVGRRECVSVGHEWAGLSGWVWVTSRALRVGGRCHNVGYGSGWGQTRYPTSNLDIAKTRMLVRVWLGFHYLLSTI